MSDAGRVGTARRPALTREQVELAVVSLEEAGERVTLQKIHERMGGVGSKTTVHRMWRELRPVPEATGDDEEESLDGMEAEEKVEPATKPPAWTPMPLSERMAYLTAIYPTIPLWQRESYLAGVSQALMKDVPAGWQQGWWWRQKVDRQAQRQVMRAARERVQDEDGEVSPVMSQVITRLAEAEWAGLDLGALLRKLRGSPPLPIFRGPDPQTTLRQVCGWMMGRGVVSVRGGTYFLTDYAPR